MVNPIPVIGKLMPSAPSPLGQPVRRAAGGTAQAGTDTTDALKVDGNVILGASASNTIDPKGKIKANLIPNADATYDLGASGSEWNN